MKGITAKDLRGNEPEELLRTRKKLEEDLFKHRMKKVTNQLENTMQIRRARRDIARVNTVLGDKLRQGGGAPQSKGAQTAEAGKET
ncbi:MAG: 50S ribosomal protein L29 [Haliangium ochraceum]